MSTLELSDAGDEFFGDNVFSVRHLMLWLDRKGLALPVRCGITEYLFVQVCALLNEIQSYAYESITHEKSVSLVMRDVEGDERFYEPISKVKISCHVAHQWREILVKSVSAGDLTLLDYASKLPVVAAASAPDRVVRMAPYEPQKSGHEWKETAWALAAEIHKVNFARGWGYDKLTVAAEIEKILGPSKLNMKTKTGKAIDRNYIVRYALTGWNKRFGVDSK
jgi:hypothetical protein